MRKSVVLRIDIVIFTINLVFIKKLKSRFLSYILYAFYNYKLFIYFELCFIRYLVVLLSYYF